MGAITPHSAWCATRSLTGAQLIVRGFGSVTRNCPYGPGRHAPDSSSARSAASSSPARAAKAATSRLAPRPFITRLSAAARFSGDATRSQSCPYDFIVFSKDSTESIPSITSIHSIP